MKWLIAALIFYIFALFVLYIYQDRIIFNSSFIKDTPLDCQDCEEINLSVEKDINLVGKERYPDSSKLLIYFGGNADDATRIFNYLSPSLDMHVIALNYRGYQKSNGKPSQNAIFKDALKIYDEFAKGREVVVMGRSLGTGVAMFLASKRVVEDLILITPYDSIREVAKSKYPIFPVKYLIKHPFDSTAYANDIKVPVYIVEVIGDKVVPNENTKKLLAKLDNIAFHSKIKDVTHGNVLEAIDFNLLFSSIVGK